MQPSASEKVRNNTNKECTLKMEMATHCARSLQQSVVSFRRRLKLEVLCAFSLETKRYRKYYYWTTGSTESIAFECSHLSEKSSSM
jgi:hypothetical protein